jgi:DNA-directed RNA polymerase sigma subunit (sigma70/sigma32)
VSVEKRNNRLSRTVEAKSLREYELKIRQVGSSSGLPRSATVECMSNSNGALNNYLPEVERVPLLTPDEEIELGRRTRNGNSPARERMIHSNVRLVTIIARDYVDFGLPLLDLISEGNTTSTPTSS